MASEEELRAAHCWEGDDRVPGRPAMTAFRRAARLHQARWREAHGHPSGTQPIVPRPGHVGRSMGSRMPLPYAQRTGANFLTRPALDSARSRAMNVEPHQTFDRQRLWADLLSSQALAFNLFADARRADAIVRRWFADAPGPVESVRFAHSPGRLDPAYLNSLRAFAAAFTLDAGGGRRGILAVEVLYHERNKAETPRPENHARYAEVAARSGAFSDEAVDALLRRSDLCVPWLEHLLLHSMLQHPSGTWTWGRLVVVHPAANVDAADLCARYRSMLGDATTFAAVTLEELVESGALGPATTAVRRRYVVD